MWRYLFLCFLLGCASTVRTPQAPIVRSQNSGMGGKVLSTFLSKGERLQSAQDFRAEVMEHQGKRENNLVSGLRGTFGVIDALDVTWNQTFGGPLSIGLLWGPLGAPRTQAKAWDYSLVFGLGYGLLVSGGVVPGGEVQSSEQVTRKFILEFSRREFSVAAGINPLDMLHVYVGLARENYALTTSFQEGAKDKWRHRGANDVKFLGAILYALPWQLGLQFSQAELTTVGDTMPGRKNTSVALEFGIVR